VASEEHSFASLTNGTPSETLASGFGLDRLPRVSESMAIFRTDREAGRKGSLVQHRIFMFISGAQQQRNANTPLPTLMIWCLSQGDSNCIARPYEAHIIPYSHGTFTFQDVVDSPPT